MIRKAVVGTHQEKEKARINEITIAHAALVRSINYIR
jgi:hypothetical protein